MNVLIALDVCAGSLMFALLCWHVPRLFSTLMSGSPSLGHGEAMAAIAGISVAASRLTDGRLLHGWLRCDGGEVVPLRSREPGRPWHRAAAARGTYGNGGGSAGGAGGVGRPCSSHVASVKAAIHPVSPPEHREKVRAMEALIQVVNEVIRVLMGMALALAVGVLAVCFLLSRISRREARDNRPGPPVCQKRPECHRGSGRQWPIFVQR